MPSRCALTGCDKSATIQAFGEGERWRYYCCTAHLNQAGAVQSEANKKQRQASNQKTKKGKSIFSSSHMDGCPFQPRRQSRRLVEQRPNRVPVRTGGSTPTLSVEG